MSKRIYSASSFAEFLKTLLYKLVIVVFAVYSYAHYEENPGIVSIVIVICLFAVFFLSTDQVLIYDNRVIQKSNSFFSLIFKRPGITYFLIDIELAFLQPLASATEVTVVSALKVVLPKSNVDDTKRPIFLQLKNGETVELQTDLNLAKREEIIAIINSLIK